MTAARLRRALPFAVAGLLLFLAFALLHRHQLRADLVENGDLAANSLLVLEAKQGLLRTGNYSRVGFNHPGPAILYALAFGEWLFHDLLHVVRAPIAGQLLGQALYSTAWVLMLAALFARWHAGGAAARAWRAGIAGTAVFLALAARVDHNLLATIWFPDLYFLPFAVFFLASARLLAGRGDALLLLAWSLGTLVHGHAAFAAVCGLMLALLLALNALLARAGWVEARVLSAGFLRAHARRLGGVLAIGALFALPLLLETLARWPGPVADYVRVGRGGEPHAWVDAFRYVVQYWTGPRLLLPALAVGMAWALWLLSRRRPALSGAEATADAARLHDARVLLLALVVASVAVLAYARFGIDLLQETYVALFYQAAPIALVAWGAVALAGAWSAQGPPRMARAVPAAIAAVALLAAVPPMRHPVGNIADYHRDGIAQAWTQVSSQGQAPLVLELDSTADWGAVWTTTVGLQAHAARQPGAPRVCIGANWHILFTRRAACTDADRAAGRVLRVTAAPPAPDAPPALAAVGPVRFESETR